ncbi:hypothetical protein ACNIS4_26895, partial [Escherichia coli]
IVTSHDDVCFIEFQEPASLDFNLAHKEIGQILKRAQVRPLAVGGHNDRPVLHFFYTSEGGGKAPENPDEAGVPGGPRPRP